MRALLSCLLMLAMAAASAVPADAATSRKKAIWGPTTVSGVSQFPIYADLGAGIYQLKLRWSNVARSRPARPEDPADPAYRWPAQVEYALSEAAKYDMEVSLTLIGTPPWANGGRSERWAPRRVEDLAAFAEAAARRYPAVRHWMVWAEPSRQANFMPLSPERRGRPLTRRQARGPRLYARMLDAAYGALKAVSSRNLVIGGNTFTTGDISPRNFITAMRLPNGRPPRMDLYGHNPFSARRPDLSKPLLRHGFVDFSGLDTLARWTDRYLRRPGGRPLRLFLSEFFLPTDHQNHEFNFYVSREVQARWLTSALRITRGWSRIYTFGWFALYDDRPRRAGDEVNRGLLERDGDRKPAYFAYRRG